MENENNLRNISTSIFDKEKNISTYIRGENVKIIFTYVTTF